MVSLRQLRYLESLAETRHFGHAAEACAVSQPALSMQIKELEEELKVSLVERRKSGVELTEKGEEVVRRARTILASVRDLVDYAKQQEGVLSGVLRLGAIPSIAGSDVATGDVDEHLSVVLDGRRGTAMRGYAAQLSDVELAAVVTYQRNAFGNDSGETVQPARITAAREL